MNTVTQAPAEEEEKLGPGKYERKNKMTAAELEVARRRARQRWAAKQKEQGRCIQCTRMAVRNRETGKRGLRCRFHQAKATEFNRIARAK